MGCGSEDERAGSGSALPSRWRPVGCVVVVVGMAMSASIEASMSSSCVCVCVCGWESGGGGSWVGCEDWVGSKSAMLGRESGV